MARTGRPRSKIDRGEFLAAFARMSTFERAQALEMMTAIHEAMSPIPAEDNSEPASAQKTENSAP